MLTYQCDVCGNIDKKCRQFRIKEVNRINYEEFKVKELDGHVTYDLCKNCYGKLFDFINSLNKENTKGDSYDI